MNLLIYEKEIFSEAGLKKGNFSLYEILFFDGSLLTFEIMIWRKNANPLTYISKKKHSKTNCKPYKRLFKKGRTKKINYKVGLISFLITVKSLWAHIKKLITLTECIFCALLFIKIGNPITVITVVVQVLEQSGFSMGHHLCQFQATILPLATVGFFVRCSEHQLFLFIDQI